MLLNFPGGGPNAEVICGLPDCRVRTPHHLSHHAFSATFAWSTVSIYTSDSISILGFLLCLFLQSFNTVDLAC
ncbi:hypothetical protein BDP81DRAFT_442697 [Colletotrichum phormii]|uniref:Uncharacterized protein n=1 Tax=Colletotrichum phormii TaxID=359342 RepID=A0AAI9ZE72_9PEZI|nr:uncharacterized protein BDP81DRAFT_442697 [Colletotrichum phormii]KAK1621876.1 hypothetical protein BDP81DRAFT_442697 [Colletotrichum phormii]